MATKLSESANNIYNNSNVTPDLIYNSYNTLLFSNDFRVFSKMTKRIELYLKIFNLPGDILEFGVFKGAGMALWLKLKNMYEPNSNTKIIGFDIFSENITIDNLTGNNKILMQSVLSRVDKNDLNIETINSKLKEISDSDNFLLIKGDASYTSKEFTEKNVGARIKLLYMDMDLDKPTFDTLMNLWDNIVVNGIIVLDEYGYHCWDESRGVDRFLKTIRGKYTLTNTLIGSPTVYITKTMY